MSAPPSAVPPRRRTGRTRPAGRAALALLGALLAVCALAGCGAGGSAPTAAAARSVDPSLGKVTTGPDGVQLVTIETEDDYAFTPDRFTVAPGRVRLTVRNVAKQFTHAFRFTPGQGPQPIAAEISLLPPGQEQTVDFTVQAPGAYRFECPLHTQLGQVGTMTVSG